MKHIISQHGFKQVISKATRVTKETSTLIDIAATSHEQNISKQGTWGISLSDHDLIGVIVKKNNRKFTHRTILKRNFSKYNEESFQEDLNGLPWQNVTKEINVNKAWNIFKHLLTEVINKHAPMVKKKVRGRDCPWLNNDIRSKMNERDYHLRKARRTGNENDWSTYRRLRNTVTRLIRHSKATYTRAILRENISRPKDFWSQIKRCYPTKGSKGNNCKLLDINGKRETDKKVISNAFCTFFTLIGKTLRDSVPSLVSPIWKNHDHGDLFRTLNPRECVFKFKQTSCKEIYEILRKLKRKKSPGYDDIPVSLIIDGAAQISGPLSKLINRCLRQSVFPSAEKWAKITPIYKSGERSSMDNYRPISVLPVLSKVFERVVYKQVYSYLEEDELLSQKQFGFRNKSSTQHAVTLFSDFIRQGMDKGKLTGAVFLVLRKAYDTVDHSRVLSKLPLYGISHEELQWFENYLFDRKQSVQFDGIKSETQSVSCGVPQGSTLGPLLFTLLINDISLKLSHCETILYADDTVIYCADKNCESIERQLNIDIGQIAEWLTTNNLVANLKRTKTECLPFGTHQRTSKSRALKIKMNEQSIFESKSYEYLGVTLDKKS